MGGSADLKQLAFKSQKSKVLRNFLFSLVQLFTAAKEKNHDLDYGFQYSDTNDNASEDINCSKYRQIRDESFHIVYFMGLGSQTPTRKGLAGVRSFLLAAQSR
ncbi:MAG: hypothetical protein V7K92_18360 [Nostoc sp.]|uniref:hypothetical protein n=1 Tax=Nostoc sp. TaxID=1180 RepID=UPI002FF2431E